MEGFAIEIPRLTLCGLDKASTGKDKLSLILMALWNIVKHLFFMAVSCFHCIFCIYNTHCVLDL